MEGMSHVYHISVNIGKEQWLYDASHHNEQPPLQLFSDIEQRQLQSSHIKILSTFPTT